ncbi:MAG: prephenate dehydrogenase/arogenate dehydrogenase family protein [Herpetosiphon sp.]
MSDAPTPVAILGLGLIGGSLGLAFRALETPPTVRGWDRDSATIATALRVGAISDAAATIASCVAGARLVILAAPVRALHELLAAVAPHLQPGVLVTDVGSTKQEVCAWAAALLPSHAHFLGGHPMAGSERHGIANARADLFKGARYCLTPTTATDPALVTNFQRWVTLLGATPLISSPAEHDNAVAIASHLPFILSTLLMQVAASDPAWERSQQWAATGFRDITRLAGGEPVMHADICLTNNAALGQYLHAAAAEIAAVAGHLDDPAWLNTWFEQARNARASWLQSAASVVPIEPSRGP